MKAPNLSFNRKALNVFTRIFYGTDLWLFDLDGTLIDSHAQIADALEITILEAEVRPPEKSKIKSVIGLSLEQMLVELKIPRNKHDFIQTKFRSRLQEEVSKGSTLLLPGVEEALSKLRIAEKKIAIATNKPTELAESIVRNSNLMSYIQYVSGSTSQKPKPNPGILENSIAALGGKSPVMVGDRPEDTIAAKQLKIYSIQVFSKLSRYSSYQDADLYLESMLDLVNLLRKL